MISERYLCLDRRDGQWKPVRILRRWRAAGRRSGPRNVLVEYEDGWQVIRPFRGLRVLPKESSG